MSNESGAIQRFNFGLAWRNSGNFIGLFAGWELELGVAKKLTYKLTSKLFYIHRLKVSTFTGANDEKDSARAWKVFGHCETKDPDSLSILQRLAEFDDKDASAVVDGLIKLLQRAPAGQPLEGTYNKKQCHEAFSFKYKGKARKVWRIWPGGVVRIYFMYGNDKNIIVSWALAKREDKLTVAEKNELESLFKALIDAQEANQLVEVTKK